MSVSLLDLGAYFCGFEGLTLLLQLGLRRIFGRLAQRVEDVALLILALLRETFEAGTGAVPLQQFQAQLLENNFRFGRVDGVRIHENENPLEMFIRS